MAKQEIEHKGVIQAQFIDLSAQDPKPYTNTNKIDTKGIIPFGSDNLFPQALALYARKSPNHRGIINSKQEYIIGDGIVSEDQATIDMLHDINSEGETIDDVLMRLLLDDLIFGNNDWELITDKDHTFLWISQIDASKVRLGDKGKTVVIHPDWKNDTGADDTRRKVLPLYPNFEPDSGGEDFPAYRCVFHFKRYEPEFTYYGIPSYISAKDSIEIDFRTNRWNLARLKNSFRISGIMVVPVKDKAESKEVLAHIKKNYIGEDNQAKLLTITKSRARENEKADRTELIETKQHDEGSWEKLHKQSTDDMIVSHGWYRSLTSLPDNTGFDTQRIINEYEIALNTIITNYQREYISLIKKFYREVLGQDIDIKFKNRPPLQSDNYKYVWELREERGLDFDPKDPAQLIIVMPSSTQEKRKEPNG